MKKLLLLLLCLPLFVACGDNGEDDITSSEKTITYKFNTNATPTGTNNLIGVQIYQGTKTNSSDMVMYSPYAYGLFDDFSKIKLDLPKEYEYRIVSTVVVDGKSKVGQDNNGYLKPFSIRDKGTALTNTFTLDSEKAMLLLNESTTTVVKSSNKKSGAAETELEDVVVPQLDRYYGEAVEYSGESKDNPVVDMDRYVFGVRLNVTFEGSHIEPTDCIFLTIEGSSDTLKVYASDEVKSIERMYTFTNLSKEQTPRSIPLRVFYKDPFNGELIEFSKNATERLYRGDLMILNQTVYRDETSWKFPFKWDAIIGYYGDRGN